MRNRNTPEVYGWVGHAPRGYTPKELDTAARRDKIARRVVFIGTAIVVGVILFLLYKLNVAYPDIPL